MLRILIVEDQPVHISLVRKCLSQCQVPHLVVGEAQNLNEAYHIILDKEPNVLLLDVDLGNETSFDLFDQVDYKKFEVIFMTAHHGYAVNAFDYEAIGYLVKPVAVSQLEKFLLVAQNNLLSKGAPDDEHGTIPLSSKIGGGKTLAIPSDTGFDIISTDELIRCESVNSSTYFFLTGNRRLISSYSIGKFSSLLTTKDFFQVHRSHIINVQFIKQYNRAGIVLLKDGSEIPVSKKARASFLSLFQ